ncbi:MAG TPA: SWIB/MDM2 domain-containing protein [Vicinamibacterales bacterium]|nr:SWIB/MDM2 domain-containing protein [Vicinamibacterales bacterium]
MGVHQEEQATGREEKRNINADAKLKVIFRKPTVQMFEMSKLVSAHLT